MPRGSWYSQLPPFGWFDPEDRPGSAAYQVGGRPIPDSQQGIALPTRGGLGKWYNVTPPGSDRPVPLQQTDIGPAPYTGRGIDISAAGAHQMGYTPKNFPTDANFKAEPIDLTGLGLAAKWNGGVPGDNQTAVAEGPPPPQQGRKMPNSLMDMFQPQDAAGQPTDLGGALTGRSNSLIGLGLGLLSPSNPLRGQSGWSQALEGYMSGAGLDARQATSKAALAHQKTQDARQAAQDLFQRSQATQAQSNWERTFKASQEVKPSVHWTPDTTDEKGDTIRGKPYLVNPNGSYRELTLEGAQNLSSALPQTGAVPGAPAADQQASDETAIPSTATTVQATPAPTLPINRREAIKTFSHKTGEQAAATAEREKVGSRVMGMLDSLEKKTSDPLFEQSAGPLKEYASGQPIWNPARAVYEYSPLGPSEKAKTFLDTIKQDAQSINSELQRAYLSGQGSVTENERAQISQILGNIAAARSPEAARTMLKNVRGLIAASFQKGYVVPEAPGPSEPPQAPAKPGLEGMSKKEIQQELIRRGVLSANST